jgi:hypothetical protein
MGILRGLLWLVFNVLSFQPHEVSFRPWDVLVPLLVRIQSPAFETSASLPPNILRVNRTALPLEVPSPSDAAIETPTELAERIDDLSAKCAVRIELNQETGCFGPNITGNACRSENAPGLLRLAHAFAPALLRYEPGFLADKVGLRRVLICEDLRISDFHVSGTIDFQSGTLFISHSIENHVIPNDGWQKRQQHCIHHEIFHMIEGRYRDALADEFRRWEEQKPASWEYGRHGLDVAKSMKAVIRKRFELFDLDKDGLLESNEGIGVSSRWTHPRPGLLTEYSQASVREDRAEFFAALMQSPESLDFAMRVAEQDSFVYEKLLILGEILVAVLEKQETRSDRDLINSLPAGPPKSHEQSDCGNH